MNENKPNAKVITVKDLWNVLRGCFVFVILAAVLCTGLGYVWGKINYSPKYSSTTRVMLLGENEGDFDITEFANDYNVAFRIIDECIIMLNSRTVRTAVGKDLIAAGYEDTGWSITINNPEETRVIDITATADSPEMAKAIVDSICVRGAEEIDRMYGYKKFTVFEYGIINTWPINAIGPFSYLKYGIVAAFLVYLVFFAMFLFDNYIHTEEDIENYLGVKIIGDIPDANAPDKRKKKYTNYSGYKMGGQPYISKDKKN